MPNTVVLNQDRLLLISCTRSPRGCISSRGQHSLIGDTLDVGTFLFEGRGLVQNSFRRRSRSSRIRRKSGAAMRDAALNGNQGDGSLFADPVMDDADALPGQQVDQWTLEADGLVGQEVQKVCSLDSKHRAIRLSV